VTATTLPLVVCGAHLSGQPLNHQLTELSARLRCATKTAACYRLYALEHGNVAKPGLLRVARDGKAFDVEVWDISREKIGEFIVQIASPLGLGSVLLEDGSSALGFLCESFATEGARDISHFSGWLSYLGQEHR
jgi:allophanate hydrolase